MVSMCPPITPNESFITFNTGTIAFVVHDAAEKMRSSGAVIIMIYSMYNIWNIAFARRSK